MQTPYELQWPRENNSEYHKTNGPKVGHGHDASQRTVHLATSHVPTLLKQPLQTAEVIGTTSAICLNVNTDHNCQKNGAMMLGSLTNAAVLTSAANT